MKYLALLALALGQATLSTCNTDANLIINGQFQRPNVNGGWQVFQNGIEGWQSKSIQIGRGGLYNHRWANNQVCQLDTHANSEISQVIHTHYPFVVLSLDYAAREHLPLQTSQMEVLWNGQVIRKVCPTDYNVNHIETQLQAISGQNTLAFRGQGSSNSLGMTIDNVKIVPFFVGKSHIKFGGETDASLSKNFVNNGNFQEPQVSSWQLFQNGVQSWQGKQMQIGKAYLYNSNWPNAAHNQVCQLDSNGNNEIWQSILTKYPFVKLRVDYAARQHVALQSSQMTIIWNGHIAQQVRPQNYNVNHLQLELITKEGANTLTFRGSGANDSLGITIDNVEIIPDESKINLRNRRSQANQIFGHYNGLKGSNNYLQGDYNRVDGDGNFVFGGFNDIGSDTY